MWAELLPKMVGGMLADDDAPNEPTRITGFELTDKWVEVTGEAFSFGASREYAGISAGRAPGILRINTMFGMGATVTMPESKG